MMDHCWRARNHLPTCVEGEGMLLKIEPVKQPSNFSCGGAALAMLLRFHGATVPKDVYSLCSPDDGLQPDAVKAVLQRQWGHYTSARMTVGVLRGFLSDEKPVLCPVLLPGEDVSHWVVTRGVTRCRVHFVCPEQGEKSLPVAEWLACWRDEAPGRFVSWGVTSWPV